MSQYSCDAKGIVRLIDDNFTVLFDRKEGVDVPGWSKESDVVNRFPGIPVSEVDGTVGTP